MKDGKRNVLLISHDTLQARYLAQGLEKKGTYSVKIAASGRAAVRIHKQTALDLALCDVGLRGSMGSDETIRQLSLLSPVNFILVAEPGTNVPKMPVNLTSKVTYLNKPVSIDELLRTIDSVTNSINKPDTEETQVKSQEKPALPEEARLKKNGFGGYVQ